MIPSFLNEDHVEDFLDAYEALCKEHNLTILPGFQNADLVIMQADHTPNGKTTTELQHSLEILRN